MAVVLSSSYGSLSREELRQTREDMAFISKHLRNMTDKEKAQYRKNPRAGMKRLIEMAAKERTHKKS